MSIKKFGKKFTISDTQNQYCLIKEVVLNYACKSGNLEIVKLLIKDNININLKDTINRTPLRRAAKNGHLEIVKLLIKKNADPNIEDRHGLTPLLASLEFEKWLISSSFTFCSRGTFGIVSSKVLSESWIKFVANTITATAIIVIIITYKKNFMIIKNSFYYFSDWKI